MISDFGWCKIICLEKVRFKGEKKFLLVKKKEIMYLLILWVLENK